MPVALEKFVKQLEDSGILAGDTIKDFIPPKASPKDAEELARELVRKKKLTKFQAEEVSKGNGKFLVLGNYVLMEKIGAGGMGQVFKAEHRRMHRTVAIKMLPPNVTKDAAAVARFEREVTAAAKLRHPNIVAADDADCANGIHFLVMELVEGQDLSALVKKNGPFSVVKAVNYILQAAKGLEAAHKKGIVHRDIKPANLLLDKEGVVKILDMGLARLSLDGDEAPQADLTSTGTIMGTVDYMAPEQALDTKAADARADIYALGCSLYFLLTGKATYDGDTLMKKLLAHRERPIPALRTIRPEVSEQLEAVFKKLVAKKVEDRYQSMTEVIVDLEQCTAGSTTSVTTQQPATTTFEDGAFDFLKKPLEEPTILATPPKRSVPGKRGLGKNKFALIGAAVLGVAMLVAIVVSLKTKDGTLVVEVDQPDSLVQVLDDGGKVEISKKGGGGKFIISVDPGKKRLKVEKDGFTTFGQEFEMERNGKKEITAKLVPLDVSSDMVEERSVPAVGKKKSLAFQMPGFDDWVKQVAAMPAEKQVEAVSKKLMELNPGFDGKLDGPVVNGGPTITDGIVTALQLVTDHVTDISPVRALSGLRFIGLYGTTVTNVGFQGQCADLSPLKGMPLNAIAIDGNPVADLSPLKGMAIEFFHAGGTEVSDLSLLRGMPLTHLNVGYSQVRDMSPLSGMKLKEFNCNTSAVSDISQLAGMPLEYLDIGRTVIVDMRSLKELPLKFLWLDFKPSRDTELLRSIKTLETINGKPAAEFWREVEAYEARAGQPLAFETPGFEEWVMQVAALPAEEQVKSVITKMKELNPGFDGDLQPTIESGVVVRLVCSGPTHMRDISPLRALKGLTQFACGDAGGWLSDLSPLKGLPLTDLDISYTSVTDLSPLKGMKLITLSLMSANVADLSPLKGLPLAAMSMQLNPVSDLSPLKGMSLEHLNISLTPVTDISPLQGIPLVTLNCSCGSVTDFSLIRDMPLKVLILDFNPKRDTEILRSVKTLETINRKPAAEFWKEVEAKQKAKKPLAFQMPGFDDWVKQVATMPAEKQLEAVSKKLVELNPGFDGKLTGDNGTGTPRIEGGVVIVLSFLSDNVTDISPIQAFKGLKALWCNGSNPGKGKLSDLSPLRGLELNTLNIGWTHVSDLAPVQGMPLASILIFATPVADLSPLRGMKLQDADLGGSQVSDLSPLKDMPLKSLHIQESAIIDMSSLAGMKLTELTFEPGKITKGIEIIRRMELLEIIVTPDGKRYPADEFWKKYDAGEFGKAIPQ